MKWRVDVYLGKRQVSLAESMLKGRNLFVVYEARNADDERSSWLSEGFWAGQALQLSFQRCEMHAEYRNIKILFIAGFGPIVRETAESRKLYSETLGIHFKEESGEYLHTEALKGVKTFALWPLSEAAQSCFGKDSWPENIPIPHAWLEFDVDSVQKATAYLESQGYRMLIKNKKEPWGQTVSRFLSPEGLLVGITYTPLMREEK